jgi:hypothetical protein
MSASEQDVRLLLDIAALEERARAATNVPALGFCIANDPFSLLGFRQSLVYEAGPENWTLMAVSGLARPAEDSPYLVWLRQAARWLRGRLADPLEAVWLTRENAGELPEAMAAEWIQWWPEGLWCVPVHGRGELRGWAIYLLDAPPSARPAQALTRLAASWGYCWAALAPTPRRWMPAITRRRAAIAVAAVLLIGCLPVRQTALAPAEVVSLDTQMIASPLDGVVRSIAVRPNETVHKGQRLFSLDDTTLRNRLNVAQRAVETANAELIAASQKTFDDVRSRDEVGSLAGKLEERRAELDGIRVQLDRIDVTAARDGVAVFADPNDWIGKPVTTGERIMELADPQRPAIRIDLPVADAITLDVGAPVKLYLTVHPLSAYEGKVIETSYQSLVTPDQVVAYRLRAAFDGGVDGARIGLRGTAKLFGPRVALGYFVFRRPLSSLRARLGL